MTDLLTRARRADSFFARLRGLMGRRVAPEEGLWINPCSSVHTFFMRGAIDIVFLDAQGNVLRVESQCPPWRVVSFRGAQSVLELPAGACQKRGLAAGNRLRGLDGQEPRRHKGRTRNYFALAAIIIVAICACAPVRSRDPALAALAAADSAYKEGDYAKARSQYVSLTRIVPGDAHAFFRLGNIVTRDGDLEAAVNYYREALLRDARHAKAMHNLARVEIERARALLSAASQSATDTELRLQSMALAQALEILLRPKTPLPHDFRGDTEE